MLYYIARLKANGTIPAAVPVYLNSPMAVNATRIFQRHRAEHRLTAEECDATCGAAQFVNSVEDSENLHVRKGPMIIISASGMATGGRVIHHIKKFAPDRRNTILFAGYQAGGTRGAAMLAGAETVKIHGAYIPVRAEVVNLDMLSAHADRSEILEWLKHFRAAPQTTFITHGEPDAADALRLRIEEQLAWRCELPDYREAVELI